MDGSQDAQSGKGDVMGLFPLDLKGAGSRGAGNLVAVLSLFSSHFLEGQKLQRDSMPTYFFS